MRRPFRSYSGPAKRKNAPLNQKSATLRAWRGYDESALNRERIDRLPRMDRLVDRAVQDLKLEQRRGESELLAVWNHLLDPEIVAHAQPAQIRNGVLFVNVDSPVWKDEIVRYRRHEILQRLQDAFGSQLIQKISFRIG